MDSNGHCVVVKYHLVPNKIESSTSSKPCVPITVTGGENAITYHVTDLHAGNSYIYIYIYIYIFMACKKQFCLHVYMYV